MSMVEELKVSLKEHEVNESLTRSELGKLTVRVQHLSDEKGLLQESLDNSREREQQLETLIKGPSYTDSSHGVGAGKAGSDLLADLEGKTTDDLRDIIKALRQDFDSNTTLLSLAEARSRDMKQELDDNNTSINDLILEEWHET